MSPDPELRKAVDDFCGVSREGEQFMADMRFGFLVFAVTLTGAMLMRLIV